MDGVENNRKPAVFYVLWAITLALAALAIYFWRQDAAYYRDIEILRALN